MAGFDCMEKKGYTMTKAERKILKQATDIITQELSNNDECKVPGFGKFTLRWINCRDFSRNTFQVKRVWFKPFGELKALVGGKRAAAPGVRTVTAPASPASAPAPAPASAPAGKHLKL